MQDVDSGALALVARTLQLSTAGSQLTEFQDELVQQMLDVHPFVRRALAPIGSQGIFTASILNTHVGDDTITTEVNPRSPGTLFVGNGYPDLVPPNLDVWILQAYGEAVTGTAANFATGILTLITEDIGMGWRNEASDSALRQLLMCWDKILQRGDIELLFDDQYNAFTAEFYGTIPLRLRHTANTRIRFTTVHGTGGATYKLLLTLGLFPAGMGQDVLSR